MISSRLIELAKSYLGKTETANNDAAWLEDLKNKSGNPDHWIAGESYCIAALCMLIDIICKEQNISLPFPTSLSTRTFYENARIKGYGMALTTDTGIFEVGDIAIFSDGNSYQGHAALVTGVSPEGLSTIEFNTSDNIAGDQRNGGGCFAKTRLFRNFLPSSTKLWLRGVVKTSRV